MSDTTDAPNVQPGHVIERSGDALPSYFSAKIGRDFGSPMGGWTGDINAASVLTEEAANAMLDGPLGSVAPFCKVVAK
ncbi:MAG: hypothetical protein ACREJM_15950 [Candidatus Saccharimonadales bacterium]